MSAAAAEDIDLLAKKHRAFFDPEFVDHVAALLPRIHPSERKLFEAKLARLRALPPDHELLGFRLFARADSVEAIRKAVERYPFLSLPSYHAHIEQIIEDTVDPHRRPAFERRLRWLRSLPPNPWQEALEAFAEAETEDALRAAVASHPYLKRDMFAALRATARRPAARLAALC